MILNSVCSFSSTSFVRARADSEFLVKKQVTVCSSAMEACLGAEGIVIATEVSLVLILRSWIDDFGSSLLVHVQWDEFRTLDWQAIYDSMKKPAFVFDVRFSLFLFWFSDLSREDC